MGKTRPIYNNVHVRGQRSKFDEVVREQTCDVYDKTI